MRRKGTLFDAVFCAASILFILPIVAHGQTSCNNYNCPQGMACACEDCGRCNSGAFVVTCMCRRPCDTHDGSCGGMSDCSSCCYWGADKHYHCQYVGCTGQSCPGGFAISQHAGTPNHELDGKLLNVSASPSPSCNDRMETPRCENCTAYTIDLGPIGNTPQAALLVPTDVPLSFSALRLNFKDNGVHGGSYVVRNSSGAGLVTLVILWNFVGNAPASVGAHATDVNDSWPSDVPFLGPGSEMTERISVQVLPKSGELLRQVTGTVVYAEFDDGTRVGPGVGSTGVWLRSQRISMLAAYKELLKKIQSGSDEKEVAIYIQKTPALHYLRDAHIESIKALTAEITRPRQLNP